MNKKLFLAKSLLIMSMLTPLSAFHGGEHHTMTEEAFELSYSKSTVETLNRVSTIGDEGESWYISAAHFDNCTWDRGLDWIKTHQELAVKNAILFRQNNFDLQYKTKTFDALGYVLHASEDFYAHSNWVENHIQGDIARLNLLTVKSKPNGWHSGTWSGSTPGPENCTEISVTHAELNKDSSSHVFYPEARADAILEIRFQMAEFQNKLIERDGYANAIKTLNKLGLYMDKFSSALSYPNKYLYFFKNYNSYSKYSLNSNRVMHHASIAQYWKGLAPISNNIQASFVASNNKAYFFSGSKYYRYDVNSDKVEAGYPQSITTYWPGLWERDIDAIIQYPNTNNVYVFKGSQYLRFNFKKNKVDSGYPLPISPHWHGLDAFKDGVDSALISTDKKKVYFFKGAYYISYDIASDRADSGYPKLIKGNWKGL